jgi:hypothetical protein
MYITCTLHEDVSKLPARRHTPPFRSRPDLLLDRYASSETFEDAQLPSRRAGLDGTGSVCCAENSSPRGHVLHVLLCVFETTLSVLLMYICKYIESALNVHSKVHYKGTLQVQYNVHSKLHYMYITKCSSSTLNVLIIVH